MSYVYDPIYKLIFTEPRYNGLVIRARSCSLGYFFEMQEEEYSKKSNDLGEAEAQFFAKKFAPYLVEWNITDREGKPIPATLDGLKSLDIRMLKDIATAWMIAIAGIDAPLEEPSIDGTSSQDQKQENQEQIALMESIPMEPLKENLESLSS